MWKQRGWRLLLVTSLVLTGVACGGDEDGESGGEIEGASNTSGDSTSNASNSSGTSNSSSTSSAPSMADCLPIEAQSDCEAAGCLPMPASRYKESEGCWVQEPFAFCTAPSDYGSLPVMAFTYDNEEMTCWLLSNPMSVPVGWETASPTPCSGCPDSSTITSWCP